MERDDNELYYLYNSKTKIYPDGTAVAIYCNKPKFSMVKQNRPKAPEPDTPEYWNSLKFFDVVDLFHGWYYEVSEKRLKLHYHYEPVFKRLELEHPYFCPDPLTGELIFKNADGSIPQYEKKQRADNAKRACDKIYDIVAMNEWEYFFTGTLGNTPFDPTDAKEALRPLQQWLKHQTQRKGLKYILVPEYQPKSGRIHFHGFISGITAKEGNTRIVKGYKKPVSLKRCKELGIDTEGLQVVYNIPDWKFGFTTAIKAYNGSQACARYIMKYITKDSQKIFGRYYWSSKNIIREVDNWYYEDVDFDSILTQSYSIPRTTDKYKYYTFFPGQDHFHWEQEYIQAKKNTQELLDFLNNCDVSANDIPFVEV